MHSADSCSTTNASSRQLADTVGWVSDPPTILFQLHEKDKGEGEKH